MNQYRVFLKCPYCAVDSQAVVPAPKFSVVDCDTEQGGCGQSFLVDTKVRVQAEVTRIPMSSWSTPVDMPAQPA